MYKTQKSFDVIKGIVPDFRNYSKNDVNLIALKINGESTNVVPQKADYSNITVECDNDATGTWDEENWTLVLSNLKQVPTSCSVNFTIQEGDNWTFVYTGNEQSFTTPSTGKYKIELWGADGGTGRREWSTLMAGGKGGYTVGEINLNIGQTLYIYVGEKGGLGGLAWDSTWYIGGKGGYNGGNKGGNDSNKDNEAEPAGGGGGATDIRLVNGTWSDFDSLKSRIMVAGAGGGGAYYGTGGVGGSNSIDTNVYQFGLGGAGLNLQGGSGAGGGGYMGGKNGLADSTPGNGGTSYISGHEGCKTIEQNATSDSVTFSDQSKHYSGLYFTNTKMIDGAGFAWTSEKQTSAVGLPTSGDTSGNGYARITYLGK